jgi:hypothetical protein
MLRRLQLRRALPRLLLRCLRGGDPAALAAAADDLGALQEPPLDRQAECEALCLAVASRAAAACLGVSSPGTNDGAAVLELAACVNRLAAHLAPPAEGVAGALAAAWLDRVCCFAEEGASCVCLGVQAVASKAEGGKKARGKKGKKGAAGEDSALAAAAQSLRDAATGLFKELKVSLEDRKASLSAEALAGNFSEATTSFPSLALSEFDEARARVLAAVASSQVLSVDRLMQIFDAKLGACGEA